MIPALKPTNKQQNKKGETARERQQKCTGSMEENTGLCIVRKNDSTLLF